MFLTHILLLFAVGFPGGEGRLRLRNGGRSMDMGRAAVEHLVVATCLRWIWVARVIRPPSRSNAQHSRSPDPATGDLNRTWRLQGPRRRRPGGHEAAPHLASSGSGAWLPLFALWRLGPSWPGRASGSPSGLDPARRFHLHSPALHVCHVPCLCEADDDTGSAATACARRLRYSRVRVVWSM